MKQSIQKQDIHLSSDIHCKKICSEYGLFGNFFYYTPSPIEESDRNRVYFIAGIDPALGGDVLPQGYFPEDLLRRQERCKKLFYPHTFVMDFTEENSRKFATEQLVDYCKKTEFLQNLYSLYGLEVPEKLRISEVHQLSEFYDILHSPHADYSVRKKCRKDLDWFFRREKAGGLRKAWLDYFRSEKFPDDSGPIGRIGGFLTRQKQQTSIDQLMDSHEKLHKLCMQEHEYQYFVKYIRNLYPEVTYSSGAKEVINNGTGNPKHTEPLLGKRISGEEYAALKRDRFAAEGWEGIANCKEAYFEFRDVYYKACDEPLIASVYNSITLAYAKCSPLEELTRLASQSPLCLADVSIGDFMNFVSLAKANHLRFYIDNTGQFAIPSLDKVRVIYNAHQKDLLESILNRMIEDKVSYSHLSTSREKSVSLSQVLEKAQSEKSTPSALPNQTIKLERD